MDQQATTARGGRDERSGANRPTRAELLRRLTDVIHGRTKMPAGDFIALVRAVNTS